MQFDQVQNMGTVLESTISTGSGSIGMLRKKLVGVGYGKTVTLEFTRRNRHPRTQNIKFLRVWNGLDGAKYPNFYIGQPGGSNGDWIFLYSELLKVSTHTRVNIDPKLYPVGDDQWHKEKYIWRYPSAFGLTDGTFHIFIDDKKIFDCGSWQCEGIGDDGKEYRGLPYDLCIQTYVANESLPVDSYTKIKDDVFIEVS